MITTLQNIRFLFTQNEDREVLENVSVEITDGVITQVGKGGDDRSDVVVDCSGFIGSPGFINAHTHLGMHQFRGISDEKPLHRWLEEDIFPVEAVMEKEHVRVGSLLGCMEQVKHGVTCFNDMYFHMEETVRSAKKVGMRGFVAQGLLDVDGKGKSRLSAGRRLVRKYSDKKGLIRGVWGPHSVYACSREYLEKVAEESNGDLVHIHLSETRDEVNRCFGKEGMDPTAYLEDIGLLREGFVGAHGVHLDEEAIGRLRMHGCSLVTCPVSNLMLASGVAPLALASDLFSGIGTDGVASNNGTQFLQDVKTCALITKNAFGADCLPTGYFFDLATRKGAEMLDLNAGVVETGRLGDLALFSKELISWYPFYGKKGLLSHFVYSPPSQADTVVVAGEVVLENGRILGASEEEARKDIQEKVKDFREEYELV